ncbi:flagellar biosynthesis anti-sigma factor FlgM [Erwinia oleae]|uniref:flagellar biosynthesis anti-sigma factor FlgM n=1 Tax=Erwinia oleae TaxID=796334 RepID=UPI00054E3030|nr:flagellar biosynthesis anti-sigma factor FlgM [Erwinia oleae]
MKITSDSSIQIAAPLNTAAAAGAPEVQKPRVVQAAAFSGEISQARQALEAMPEVDMERVNAMKDAIKNGELLTDNASLAAAISCFYRP